ncbi:transposase [Pseudomonas sp. G(2018)]|uniref:transposase n=1 Tax=Pseudomonas sp. G(2018) TaxID=2502242 RepID=UPI001485B9BB|nr:transposase [Pseudomonas sp. G(2018)]
MDAFENGPWETISDCGGRLATGLGSSHPVFMFPPTIRKVIYTTNVIESINAQLRKIIKTREHFPTDGSVYQVNVVKLRSALWQAITGPHTKKKLTVSKA